MFNLPYVSRELRFYVNPQHKKWSFPQKISSDLVTFTEGILNGKLHFLFSNRCDFFKSSFFVVNFENAYSLLSLMLVQLEN